MGWITDLLKELPLSAVQRERASLEEARAAAKQEQLEAKIDTLTAEKSALQTVVEAQRLKIESLQTQVDEQRRLQEEADKKRQEQSFDPVAEALLKLVCFHDGNSVEHLAGLAGVGAQVAKFHLEAMEAKKLVRAQYYSSWDRGAQCEWSVTAAGRAYLMERGLLT